jgi:uncharacterized protein (UPF0548 family)
MFSLGRPSRADIDAFLARAGRQPFSYPEVGATRDDRPPAGYAIDHRRIQVGRGERAFRSACAALREWEMFQLGWVRPCWPDTPVEPGSVVASLTRLAGIWLLNVCRIVYVDEAGLDGRRFRFAWGTLPEHVEQGEERFTIEWLDDDTVWYDLYAFSRPGHFLVRLGYPVARQMQRRFGEQSLRAMARSVRQRLARQTAGSPV